MHCKHYKHSQASTSPDSNNIADNKDIDKHLSTKTKQITNNNTNITTQCKHEKHSQAATSPDSNNIADNKD